jgi:hypothetical protein
MKYGKFFPVVDKAHFWCWPAGKKEQEKGGLGGEQKF